MVPACLLVIQVLIIVVDHNDFRHVKGVGIGIKLLQIPQACHTAPYDKGGYRADIRIIGDAGWGVPSFWEAEGTPPMKKDRLHLKQATRNWKSACTLSM